MASAAAARQRQRASSTSGASIASWPTSTSILDAPLDLETLAAVAHFSAFHFHRLFRAWTGETLGDYLRRRRIETGALRLVTQPRSIGARRSRWRWGFGSGEAFARAFKARFGRDAERVGAKRAQFRSGASAASIRRPLALDFDHGFPATRLIEDTTMTAERLADRHAGDARSPTSAHTGPYGQPVARFWMERVAPWMAENDLVRPRALRHLARRPDDHRSPATVPLRRRRRGRPEGGALGPAAAHRVARRPLRLHALRRHRRRHRCRLAASARPAGCPRAACSSMPGRMLEHYPVDASFDPQTGVFELRHLHPGGAD